ncbi:hypothetical protein BDZ91DRAFT_552818 [Kalaharituber pfeilii]|nr:hypothetical protein BDZ91DRAFT_552818 [Kalaharituber pfeilii]
MAGGLGFCDDIKKRENCKGRKSKVRAENAVEMRHAYANMLRRTWLFRATVFKILIVSCMCVPTCVYLRGKKRQAKRGEKKKQLQQLNAYSSLERLHLNITNW